MVEIFRVKFLPKNLAYVLAYAWENSIDRRSALNRILSETCNVNGGEELIKKYVNHLKNDFEEIKLWPKIADILLKK